MLSLMYYVRFSARVFFCCFKVLKLKHKIFREFFARSGKQKTFKCAHAVACTLPLHCPISAEIRAADSQSDLRVLL